MKRFLLLVGALLLSVEAKAQVPLNINIVGAAPGQALGVMGNGTNSVYAIWTNPPPLIVTNVGTAGVIPANYLTYTNLPAGNITIAGISGMDPGKWNTTILLCINTSGADRTVTIPTPVVTTDGLRVWTVTNNTRRIISFGGISGIVTNAAAAPLY